jgi:hypothetical protein
MQIYFMLILWITGIVNPGQQASAESITAKAQQAIAIPVRLLAFTGKTDGTNNTLQWQTTSEANVREFIIERSADGQTFELFAWVTPKGAFNGTAFYRYNDTTATGNETFYRLRMVDADGKEQVSRVISITKKAVK